MMMFCPKCGSLMKVKKEKGKKFLKCENCGYTTKDLDSASITEEVKSESKPVDVVEESDETLPLTEAECPKCGHNRAFYWLVQTRAGDESETKFLKCEKCGYTWRDND